MASRKEPTRVESLADIRRVNQEMREKFRNAPRLNQFVVKLGCFTIVVWIVVGILIAVGG